MSLQRHFINDIEVSLPKNYKELSLEVDFTARTKEISTSLTDLELAGKASKMISYWFQQAKNGQRSLFEGLDYKIKVVEGNTTKTVFNGLVQINNQSIISRDYCLVSVLEKDSIDWFRDKASITSFISLEQQNVFTQNDFVQVPYLVEDEELDLMKIAIMVLVVTDLSIKLVQQAREIVDGISELVNAATPNVGLGVTIDVGDIIWASLKLIARIALFIGMSVVYTKMIKDLIEYLYPPLLFYKACKERVLLQKAVESFGFSFESSIYSNNAINEATVILPVKKEIGSKTSNNNQSGVPDINASIDTLSKLIEQLEDKYNAEFYIKDNTAYFEPKDRVPSVGNSVLLDSYSNQEKQSNEISINIDDLPFLYSLKYANDSSDKRSYTDYKGTSANAFTNVSNLNTGNARNLNTRGVVDIQLPFALGSVKSGFTQFEEILLQVAKTVDKVTGLFGNGTNSASKIKRRKGVLLLNQHAISQPKNLVMQGDRLFQNNKELISAKKLLETYHRGRFAALSNSVLLNKSISAQRLMVTNKTIALTLDKLLTLFNQNGAAKLADGKQVEVTKINYQIELDTAQLDYSVLETYDKTLNLTINE